MKFVSLFICLSLALNALSQPIFKEERLNHLLEEKVNDYREAEGLPRLERREVLDAAAFDQADYLKDKNRVQHSQDHKKKETTADRVRYYGGLYAELGENAAKVSIGRREKVYPSGDRINIEHEQQAIDATLYAWFSDDNSRANLNDKYFNHFGAAVIRNDQALDIVMVFAGLPYQLPEKSRLKIPKVSIDPPKKEDCNTLWENFGTIPQLFSDAIKVEGNAVYFEFHNLATIEKIISSSGDGIAVDVICDNQFPCGSANRIYPAAVNDGFLLPLVKKGHLATMNSLKDKNKVRLKLGELPGFYHPDRCELNGIIVKNGTKCTTIPYNKFDVLDLRLLDLSYRLIGDTLKGNLQWKDTLSLSFPLAEEDENEKNVFGKIKKLTEALNYQIESISLKQSFSPIADTANSKFLENLLLKIKKEFPAIKEINKGKAYSWDAYYDFQKNAVYEIETKGMDSAAVESYLKETAETDTSLAHFLQSLNRLNILIKGKAEISEHRSLNKKLEMLQHLIEANKIQPALALQRNIIESDRAYAALQAFDIDQTKENIVLINNQIVANVLDGKDHFRGNPTHVAFLELFLIAQKYPLLNYNKYLSDIKAWGVKGSNKKGIRAWQGDFRKLQGKLPQPIFAKTMVNYAMIAANYYYQKSEFSNRRKTFDLLMKWYPLADFDEKEELKLAKYLTYQDQFHRAVELLLPKVKMKKPKKEVLFYFLQISIYEKDLLGKSLYHQLLSKGNELYPVAFCDFFSKEKRGIQALKDYQIKELYCSECK